MVTAQQCCICYDELTQEDEYIVHETKECHHPVSSWYYSPGSPGCRQTFCVRCLVAWYRKTMMETPNSEWHRCPICPMCRGQFINVHPAVSDLACAADCLDKDNVEAHELTNIAGLDYMYARALIGTYIDSGGDINARFDVDKDHTGCDLESAIYEGNARTFLRASHPARSRRFCCVERLRAEILLRRAHGGACHHHAAPAGVGSDAT